MNTYEITIIFCPNLEESVLKNAVDSFREIFTKGGANITKDEVWGIRKLAYEIKHFGEGYYINMLFESAPDFVADLKKALNLNENVLRYLIVRN